MVISDSLLVISRLPNKNLVSFNNIVLVSFFPPFRGHVSIVSLAYVMKLVVSLFSHFSYHHYGVLLQKFGDMGELEEESY
jgi:hypothetical protein